MLRWLYNIFSNEKPHKKPPSLHDVGDISKLKDNEILPFKEELEKKAGKFLCLYDTLASDVALEVLPDLINKCSLESFTLKGVFLNVGTTRALVQILNQNKTLQRLSFGGQNLTDSSLLLIADAIKSHKRLTQFSITCSPLVSEKTLLQFAVRAAENTSIVLHNVNGFIISQGRFSKGIIKFMSLFFLAVIERNKELATISLAEQNRLFSEFAKDWNPLLKAQLMTDEGDNIEIKRREFPSLTDISLFKIDRELKNNKMQKYFNNTRLPQELYDKIDVKQEPQTAITTTSRLS